MKQILVAISLLLLAQDSQSHRSGLRNRLRPITPRGDGSNAQKVSLKNLNVNFRCRSSTFQHACVTDLAENSFFTSNAGPSAVSLDGAESIDKCVQACILQPNCRSFYYGTGFVCQAGVDHGSKVSRFCHLFPRPMSKTLYPVNAQNTVLYEPGFPLVIGGNKGDAPSKAFPTFPHSFYDGGVVKCLDRNSLSPSNCRDLCQNNSTCRSWSFYEWDGQFSCNLFKNAISLPKSQSEEWTVARNTLSPTSSKGFGGVTGNIVRQPGTVVAGCRDEDWINTLTAYKKCMVENYLKAGQLDGNDFPGNKYYSQCKSHIRKVDTLMSKCNLRTDTPNTRVFDPENTDFVDCSIQPVDGMNSNEYRMVDTPNLASCPPSLTET